MSSGSPQRAGQGARIGAVLAGGRGTRMGGPKAGVELGGRPLVAYAIEAIGSAGLEPVVVAKEASELPPVDCRIVREPETATHPAAGILTALGATGGAPVVALGCDMPFVPAPVIALLAAMDAPVAVTRLGDRLQPLPGRYDGSARSALEAAVRRGDRLQRAVRALDPLIVEAHELAAFGPPERITFNVNDRHDLAAAERMLAVASP